MTDILLKQLMGFGLSEKESKIYIALLELEIATVFEIAKQSGINRSSAYVVLEGLKKKGLVGISDEKNVRRYVAASPEILLHAAKTVAKKQEDIKSGIESIIPELKALHKATKRKPIVKVFEGENGAKEVYWSIFSISSKEKILRTFANPVNIFKRLPDFQEHDEKRAKNKIKMYAINPATKDLLNFKVPPNPPFESALIPEEKFRFSSDMAIFEDRVLIASPKDNFGIIIESQEIADMLKNSFDLAWEEAKRLDKVIRKQNKLQ